MNIEELRLYCLSKPGAEEDMPFDDSCVAMKVMGKMFALVWLERYGVVALKCDPELAIELRERYECVKPAFHFNKKYWNELHLTECHSDDFAKQQIDHSYDEVVKKLTKKQREILAQFKNNS